MEIIDGNMRNEEEIYVPEPVEHDFELATSGERFLAALIDVLLGGAMVAMSPKIGGLVNLAYSFTKDSLPFFEGQSIGKKVMKIRVVDADTGEPITNKYEKSVIRAVPLIIPIFNIIDALMVIIDDDKRRFGDKWANTVVVKER